MVTAAIDDYDEMVMNNFKICTKEINKVIVGY
jgi:hypothetical protein